MSIKFLRHMMAVATLLLVIFAAGQASAHLLISPQRFVFEGRVRSNTILLMNGDSKPHTYRLSWMMMKMDEKGVYHDMPMDDKDPFTVPKMVVYTPREVTVEAGGKQNVRMALRAPANLPKGEYRAHLLFSELPDDNAPKPTPNKGQSLSIAIQLGISVPVIVRSGDIRPEDVAMDTPHLATSGKNQVVKVDISHKPGEGSVYGKVTVTTASGSVGILNNIAIYPEMAKREVEVPLLKPVAPGTSVTVAYEGDGEYKGQTFVTKQVTLTQ